MYFGADENNQQTAKKTDLCRGRIGGEKDKLRAPSRLTTKRIPRENEIDSLTLSLRGGASFRSTAAREIEAKKKVATKKARRNQPP